MISAIVLAAGESTRMGQQKALLRWRGTTLIEYQLAQLSAVAAVGEMVVVTGHQPAEITRLASAWPRTRVAHNARYRTGKVSSITCGLAATGQLDGILLIAVDQPRPAEVLQALVAAHETAGALISVPVHRRHRGHPVIFDGSLRAELAAISEESLGVRAVMQRHAARINEVSFDDPVVTLDINTPEDVPPAGDATR